MKVLVLNAGSSSLKFDLFETETEQLLHKGSVERVSDMTSAIGSIWPQIADQPIDAVGHRVVHGGDRFHESVVIDSEVENEIDALGVLAPLHNPHNLAAFRAAREHLPGIPQVAVFDTAFHHTLPPAAYVYGLPWKYLEEKKIRRYGFHGISHRYVSERFAELTQKSPENLRLITCHLGNGCSICAISGGRSLDTSMGFTPLEGLVMGTRSGDIDAGAILHLITHEHKNPADLLNILNSDSGLKGISGISNDMRDLLRESQSGNERATLAVEIFCYRVKKYIGSYIAALNGADALIFTGGIGENSPEIRSMICEGLTAVGIQLDKAANEADRHDARITGSGSIPVWVIPTNEELLIARDTARVSAARTQAAGGQ